MSRRVPLAELAEINPPLRESLPGDSPVAFVPMASLSAERAAVDVAEVRRYADVRKGYTPFHSGDLLVAKITPCFENGKIVEACLPQRAAFGSSELHVIRPDSSVVNSRYLLRYLRQPSVRLAGERRMTGSAGQRRVPEAFFRGLAVPLPPLPEQRRIADILDRADVMRAKRREAIALLDLLSQAIFVDMFGAPNGGSNSGATATIDDVSEVITGYPFRSHEYVEDEEAVRLCRGANVLPDRIDWSDLARWPGEKLQGLSQFLLRPGDIVLAMDRPWISEGFKVARVRDDHCPALLVQRVARLRFETRAIGDFVFHLLKQPAFARHCRPTETTIPHISPVELRSFRFSLPPSDALNEYSSRTKTVEQMKVAHYRSLAEMDALFASLQHRAFRGEL